MYLLRKNKPLFSLWCINHNKTFHLHFNTFFISFRRTRNIGDLGRLLFALVGAEKKINNLIIYFCIIEKISQYHIFFFIFFFFNISIYCISHLKKIVLTKSTFNYPMFLSPNGSTAGLTLRSRWHFLHRRGVHAVEKEESNKKREVEFSDHHQFKQHCILYKYKCTAGVG